MSKPKDKEKEEKRAKEMLDSVPDHIVLSGDVLKEAFLSQLIYLLIKHSLRLNKLTIALIVMTGILAILTIVYIVVAFVR